MLWTTLRRNGVRLAIMTFSGASTAASSSSSSRRQEKHRFERSDDEPTCRTFSLVLARARVPRARSEIARSLYLGATSGSIAPLRGKTLQGHLVQCTVNSFLSCLRSPSLSLSLPAAISGPQFYAPPWNATLFRAAAKDDCSTAPALERRGAACACRVCRAPAMQPLFNARTHTRGCPADPAISECLVSSRQCHFLVRDAAGTSVLMSFLSCTYLLESLSSMSMLSPRTADSSGTLGTNVDFGGNLSPRAQHRSFRTCGTTSV